MTKKSIYFYLSVLTIFLGICSPFLFTYGMFMDGVFYSAVARNLALGKGSFWAPQFSETLFPVFREHPPFALWLESIFFNVFGTSIFVERFYSFFSIILVGFLIIKIWKEITSETSTAWFPLLLFISFPIIAWTAANNMLENTMSIFICCSVLFYLKGIRKKKYYFTVLSGLCLFLAVFCKSIVALFPWAIPLGLWIFSKKISLKQICIDTFILVGCTILPFVLLYFLSPKAHFFFDFYFSNQLFPSVVGLRETEGSRFHIINKLLENIIPCIILVLTMFIVLVIRKRIDSFKENINNSLVFFFLSLCGILPVMLSLKQSGFYITPAYPFLSIAFALPFQPYLKTLLDKINTSSKGFFIFKIISCVLFVSVITFSSTQKGKIGRDKKEIEIVFECSNYVSPNSTISVDRETYLNWGLQVYFARYKNITLDTNKTHLYYLRNQNLPLNLLNEKYIPVAEINNLILFRKNHHNTSEEVAD